MEDLNLLLKFKLSGESDCHIRGAARIKLDGQGGLTVYVPGSGVAETITLAQLQSLSIQSLSWAGRAA